MRRTVRVVEPLVQAVNMKKLRQQFRIRFGDGEAFLMSLLGPLFILPSRAFNECPRSWLTTSSLDARVILISVILLLDSKLLSTYLVYIPVERQPGKL